MGAAIYIENRLLFSNRISYYQKLLSINQLPRKNTKSKCTNEKISKSVKEELACKKELLPCSPKLTLALVVELLFYMDDLQIDKEAMGIVLWLIFFNIAV